MTNSTTQRPTAETVSRLESALGVLFSRVQVAWRDAAVAVDPELQPVGFKMLSVLVGRGPMHSSALADLLLIDRSVVSRQVRCMEGLGLVVSTIDPTDGRARLVAATETGSTRVGAVHADNESVLLERLTDWDDSDVETLATLLGRFSG